MDGDCLDSNEHMSAILGIFSGEENEFLKYYLLMVSLMSLKLKVAETPITAKYSSHFYLAGIAQKVLQGKLGGWQRK